MKNGLKEEYPMKIITDTTTLFTPMEGKMAGMTIIPVCIILDGSTYKDYEDISSEEFLELINAGGKPTSSQPSIGDILEIYQSSEEEMLVITVGDGLSGGYQTACGARNLISNPERIHVMDSKTLAGPLRYLAKKAVFMKEQGFDISSIKESLELSIESSASFIIAEDFQFLKRSGRLTPLAAKIGGALKLLPVLTQTSDKTRIKPITVKRTWKAAIEVIIHELKEQGVNEEYIISVCHAGTYDRACSISQQLGVVFLKSEIEILTLSPALITHGGPGCIVVQAIKK